MLSLVFVWAFVVGIGSGFAIVALCATMSFRRIDAASTDLVGLSPYQVLDASGSA